MNCCVTQVFNVSYSENLLKNVIFAHILIYMLWKQDMWAQTT